MAGDSSRLTAHDCEVAFNSITNGADGCAENVRGTAHSSSRCLSREATKMSMMEYDNAAKWLSFFRRLPVILKSCLGVVAIVVVSIWTYVQFGPMRKLSAENESLLGKLDTAKTELTVMTDRKNELYAETLYLKGILNPIQEKATLLYPELESAAAVARLAGDLQNVRALATREDYKPLPDGMRTSLVGALRSLRSQNPSALTNITVTVLMGSSVRERVANDLAQYLCAAGYRAHVASIMTAYSAERPDIAIYFNPGDVDVVGRLTSIIGTLFINEQFVGVKKNRGVKGDITIAIDGDPVFADSGIVTFK